MLKGQELLAKIKAMGEASKSDIARACGYVTTKKDGSERINFTAYYEAIIEAKGVDLGTPAPKSGKRGKALSFKAKVSKAGTIPVTAGYSSMLGLEEGDYVTIEHVDGALILRKEAAAEPVACAAPVVITPAVATVEVVTTYDSKPAPVKAEAERELAPF